MVLAIERFHSPSRGVLVRACNFHMEGRGFESSKPILAAKAADCQEFGTGYVMLLYLPFVKFQTQCRFQITTVSDVRIELACSLE